MQNIPSKQTRHVQSLDADQCRSKVNWKWPWRFSRSSSVESHHVMP